MTSDVRKQTIDLDLKSIISTSIHIKPYKKSKTRASKKRKTQKFCITVILCNLIIISIILIAIGIGYSGYFIFVNLGLVELAKPTIFKNKDFKYQTSCFVIHETEYSNLGYAWYIWKFNDTSFCLVSNNTLHPRNLTFRIQSKKYDEYDPGHYTKCWTNKQCNELYVYEEDIPTYTDDSSQTKGTYIISAATSVFICSGCWLFCAACFMKRKCKKVIPTRAGCRICKRFLCGDYDERRYYLRRWHKLDAKKKLDYYVSLHSRTFGFNAGEDVYRTLLRFLDTRIHYDMTFQE